MSLIQHTTLAITLALTLAGALISSPLQAQQNPTLVSGKRATE